MRPTLFFGVPRVWEKIREAMAQVAAKTYAKPGSGPVLKAIGSVCKGTGSIWFDYHTPEVVRAALALPYVIAKTLVFKKVRKGCGLDRCELLYTGAAPLSPDTLNYFRAVGMPLLEVFGMSEVSAWSTTTFPSTSTSSTTLLFWHHSTTIPPPFHHHSTTIPPPPPPSRRAAVRSR